LTPIDNPAVARVFDDFPKGLQRGLFGLRELVFEVARSTKGVGRLEETLKWGQPSYLTPETKSGSTLRLGVTKDRQHFGLYIHCQTDILSSFRDRFPDDFRYEGRRAILFKKGEDLQTEKLKICIAHGLTYHARKLNRSVFFGTS